MSWVFALSMLGVVLAGTPLALASAARRLAHGLRRHGRPVGADRRAVPISRARRSAGPCRARHDRAEGAREALAGFVQILRLPGILRGARVCRPSPTPSWPASWGYGPVPICTTCTVSMSVARGNVLIAMAAAQTVGVLAFGPLDRLLRHAQVGGRVWSGRRHHGDPDRAGRAAAAAGLARDRASGRALRRLILRRRMSSRMRARSIRRGSLVAVPRPPTWRSSWAAR